MISHVKARLAAATQRLLRFEAARRLIRHQEGAAAIEFGLVAAPFLALVFAILETAIIFFAGQALETAASDSARLIMTGQAQMGGFDQAKFKQEVCARIHGVFSCNSHLHVDVKKYSSFASVDTSKPIDANGNLKTDTFGYQPGEPGDIVVVRMMYEWPVYVSLLGINLSDMGGGKRLLLSTLAFRNEPYQQ